MPRLLLVLLLLPHLASCLPVLEACTVEGDPDTIWNDPDFCADPCFLDEDRDGHGAVPTSRDLWEREACLAAGHAVKGGDCDDADPRRFLGNREVCDGVDNDCVTRDGTDGEEVADPDEAPVPGAPDGTYGCTPADTPIQLFLLAGSRVGGVPVGPSGVAEIHPGETVSIELRMGVLIPGGPHEPFSGGLALAWREPPSDGFLPVLDSLGSPDHILSPTYEVYEHTVKEVTIPAELVPGSSFLATLGVGPAPEPAYVGSLTDPWYCHEEPAGPDQEPCDPVWNVHPELEDIPRDLRDMSELELASCLTFGEARLPTLARIADDEGRPCVIESDDESCHFVFESRALGCSFIELVVLPPTGEPS